MASLIVLAQGNIAETLRLDLLVRLLLAAVLGGLIGLERELSAKPAGFRTNLLICVGATLVMEISRRITVIATGQYMNGDPSRIAAQIVSGIGFLGAGVIMQAKGSVTGITTAATVWVVAAIGMAVGADMFVEACGTTALVLVALYLLGKAEKLIIRRRQAEQKVELNVLARTAVLNQVEELLASMNYVVENVMIERLPEGHMASVVASGPKKAWLNAVERLTKIPDVRAVERS